MSRILARVPLGILVFAGMVGLAMANGSSLIAAIVIVSQAILIIASFILVVLAWVTVFHGEKFSTKALWIINLSALGVVAATVALFLLEPNIISMFS